MDREDAAAVPWMAKNSRTTWPKKIVWHQSGRIHDRFYWLSVPEKTAQKGQTIKAEIVQWTGDIKKLDYISFGLGLGYRF